MFSIYKIYHPRAHHVPFLYTYPCSDNLFILHTTPSTSIFSLGKGRPYSIMSFTLDHLLLSDRDANGRLPLTVHIQQILARLSPFLKSPKMASPTSRFSGNGALSPVSEDENVKVARRLTLVRHLRAPAFQYAWTFYHDKYTESQNYEGRLTLLKEDIITAKPFWEVLNSFPFDALKLKDSVHFFKRGVKPVWEDPRNVKGGSWTFRVPKAQSDAFWKEVLMLAVGEEFVDVIQPRT